MGLKFTNGIWCDDGFRFSVELAFHRLWGVIRHEKVFDRSNTHYVFAEIVAFFKQQFACAVSVFYFVEFFCIWMVSV